jgi:hypothetical protein
MDTVKHFNQAFVNGMGFSWSQTFRGVAGLQLRSQTLMREGRQQVMQRVRPIVSG